MSRPLTTRSSLALALAIAGALAACSEPVSPGWEEPAPAGDAAESAVASGVT